MHAHGNGHVHMGMCTWEWACTHGNGNVYMGMDTYSVHMGVDSIACVQYIHPVLYNCFTFNFINISLLHTDVLFDS